MNTCKAALRILKARKLYVIIYLVLIGTMMFSISWQIMRGSTAAGATTYEPESARIAVIDRDDDAEHVLNRCVPTSLWTVRWSPLMTIPYRCSRLSHRIMLI